jgi:preprotein translocase subunit SecE
MALTNPLQFTQQVRAEITKVIWPTRRETLITTVMVFVMAFVFALFFFGVDQLVQFVLNLILAF